MVRRARQRPRRAMPAAYTVALTPGALSDLDRLDQFLREKNPLAANRMLEYFDTAFTRLAENPFDSPTLAPTTVRARVVRFGKGGYICLYEVRDRTVLIAHLFHAREDWRATEDLILDSRVEKGHGS
jgi:plasmid stabilization system protein ParE